MERITLLAEGAGNCIVWEPSHARGRVSIYDNSGAANWGCRRSPTPLDHDVFLREAVHGDDGPHTHALEAEIDDGFQGLVGELVGAVQLH